MWQKTLLIPALLVCFKTAHACVCEVWWDQTVQSVWDGDVLEQSRTDGLMCTELRYLRNAIYGRHGFVFGDEWVVSQFKDDPRYQPDESVTSQNIQSIFTPSDRWNLEIILAKEAVEECGFWWQENTIGEKPTWLNEPLWISREHVLSEEETREALRHFQTVNLIDDQGPDGLSTIVLGDITPDYAVERVLRGDVLEAVWLEPFTCEDLDHLESALFARYRVDFEDSQDEVYFASILGVYQPVVGLTRAVARSSFNSTDKLTQLRVSQASLQKNCKEG